MGLGTGTMGSQKQKQVLKPSSSFQDNSPWVLTFQNLRFTSDCGKEILHGIKGFLQGGSVTAIMGASGSGKTTLIQTLAGQRIPSAGCVELNGNPLGAATKRYIGMVPQEDVLFSSVTVEEALQFSAKLRVPQTVSEEERNQRVQKLLTELGLEGIRNSLIGDARTRKGISGGERKRCSIGTEMVHHPRVLLLDEPTSGLDSTNAHQLLLLLQELAQTEGVAVAFTIHQPSSRDFNLFDKLLIMSEGRAVYQGDADAALNHFSALGYQCPPRTNPAEFILDLVSEAEIGDEQKGKLMQSFQDSVAGRKLQDEMDDVSADLAAKSQDNGNGCNGVSIDGRAEVFATPFMTQFRVLLSRAWIQARRNPVSSKAAFGRSVTMGLLLGVLYNKVDLTQASVQDRTGALYFVLTTQVFSAQGSMRMFLEERDLFLRERLAGAYRTSAYFWSKSMADTPLQLLYAFMFSLLGYYLVGFQATFEHVFTYCVAIVVTTLAAESCIVAIGAAASDDKTAAVLGPVAFAIMSLLGGFFSNIDSLPVYISWLQYFSLFRYSFSAIMQNEFAGLTFTCSPEDSGDWLEKLDESTRVHVEEFLHLLPCPTPDGETHLHRLKLDRMDIWSNIFILFLLMIGFRVLGFWALVRRTNKLVPGAKLVKSKQTIKEHSE